MSEIDKLYENAKVEKSKCWDDCNTCTRTSCDKNISYVKAEYPPFTAEKQIDIIKFLISKHARFDMFKNYEQKDLYTVHYECRYFPKQYLPFEEALAESINYLWQSLTDTEKEHVRDILKG